MSSMVLNTDAYRTSGTNRRSVHTLVNIAKATIKTAND